MYPKSLNGPDLWDSIDQLCAFVNTAHHNTRRVKVICCDKFPSYLDQNFVGSIRAIYGIELICSPPYSPDKHPQVEQAHHKCQQLLRKMLHSLPGTKLMREHIRNAPTDRRHFSMLHNRTWWASAHNYATQLLNNSTYTRLTSPLTMDVDLRHTAYQTFYGKRNHVVAR